MFKTETYPIITPEPGRLFVIVPAMGQTCRDWTPLRERLSKEPECAGADWLLYDHHLHFFSTRRLFQVARGLAAQIHEMHQNHNYTGITLLGHGVGGILVRMAYLTGLGDGTADSPRRPWSQRVERLVLFATLNRGYDPKRWGAFSWLVRGLLLIPIFHLARSYMRGSSAIADLRISWIKHFRQFAEQSAANAVAAGADGTNGPARFDVTHSDVTRAGTLTQPIVIQINGSWDQHLDAEDSADVDQFSHATQEFLQGVSRSDTFHLPPGQEEERYLFLRHQILTAQGDSLSPHTDPAPKDVVFLVHGIRACSSDWPARAAEIIKRNYPNAVPVAAGYSYFSALNFAVPFMRRMQIRWIQDEYSYCFTKYPNARFYFLGHSNGTYLLGRLLDHVPSVKFKRVTLAGSVLPQSFPWKAHLDSGRVAEYQNHRAARDLPVGLLCNLLRGCGMKDIGTAGFNGFLPGDTGQEVFYYQGGHGSALKDPKNLAQLIRYTLTGESTTYGVSPSAKPGSMSLASRVMPYVPVGIVMILAACSYAGWITLTAAMLPALSVILLLVLFILKVA